MMNIIHKLLTQGNIELQKLLLDVDGEITVIIGE
jgi:hypothetical protein